MKRKRITQVFPCLLPLRKKQRKTCFYLKQKLDKHHYARTKEAQILEYPVFEAKSKLVNPETGFDLVYQENKIHNLKLVADTMNHLMIMPGETFSFWECAHNADKEIPYKEGLVSVNGEIKALYGGGLCQMSSLLFWLFLHVSLTIIERHGHACRSFPEPPGNSLYGVDATISEGWLDLKVKNETSHKYQIEISFDGDSMTGTIYSNELPENDIWIENGERLYFLEQGKVYEEVDVIQKIMDKSVGKCLSSRVLYRNRCEIGYQLPENIKIKRE